MSMHEYKERSRLLNYQGEKKDTLPTLYMEVLLLDAYIVKE